MARQLPTLSVLSDGGLRWDCKEYHLSIVVQCKCPKCGKTIEHETCMPLNQPHEIRMWHSFQEDSSTWCGHEWSVWVGLDLSVQQLTEQVFKDYLARLGDDS